MEFFNLLGRAAKLWFQQGADQHAAALAYFMPFALTPLIIFSITIVGFMVGSEQIITMLLRWGNSIDTELTQLIYTSVQNFNALNTYYLLPILGVIFLSLMIVFALNSYTSALHDMWNVKAIGWRNYAKRIFRIFLVILVLQGYLIMIILLNNTFVAFTWLSDSLWWQAVHSVISFFITVVLIMIMYGVLALESPPLSARFAGAIVAGTLLLFSRELVALHFATAPVQSLFGAAGLLISLLVWVYVSAGILLFGAAFAKVYETREPKFTQ